jgi:4,5-dihydroxyphthalate decarboxylase
MLHTGEIDALLSARYPSSFLNGSPNVGHLFPNYREVEENYFRKTGVFPIMHALVIKREVYEANRWIAMSLYKAFCKAKDVVMNYFDVASALYITLPWLIGEADRTSSIMGKDFWPYGIEPNLKTLEAFLNYHYDQGLSARKMTIEELFAPETMSAGFKI